MNFGNVKDAQDTVLQINGHFSAIYILLLDGNLLEAVKCMHTTFSVDLVMRASIIHIVEAAAYFLIGVTLVVNALGGIYLAKVNK